MLWFFFEFDDNKSADVIIKKYDDYTSVDFKISNWAPGVGTHSVFNWNAGSKDRQDIIRRLEGQIIKACNEGILSREEVRRFHEGVPDVDLTDRLMVT